MSQDEFEGLMQDLQKRNRELEPNWKTLLVEGICLIVILGVFGAIAWGLIPHV